VAKRKKPIDDSQAPSFEEALAELEEVVADLEGGELPLAEALERYETGVRRLKQCHQQLAQAERKIELLSGVDAQGNPITKPFDAQSTLEAAEGGDSAASRARRRSTGGSSTRSSGNEVDGGSRLF
jgi:exodeoxyribonuclease VII small subunit